MADLTTNQSRRSLIPYAYFVLSVTVIVVFLPGLNANFWTDDYIFLETVGRLNSWDYFLYYFDPRSQLMWYRPIQGVQWWIEYALFHSNPIGYHLVQLLLHLANALLLFGLVREAGGNWRIGFLATLIWAVIPLSSLAVLWPAVSDPLGSLFFLLTLALWLRYLKTGTERYYGLTVAVFSFSLLTKEILISLPLLLFLADRLLVNSALSFGDTMKRYWIFFLLMLARVIVQIPVLTQGSFRTNLGYGEQGQEVAALVHFLFLLSFPWGTIQPVNILLLGGIVALVLVGIVRRDYRPLFLGLAALLPLAPLLPFPLATAQQGRYLYLPLMASAIAFGWMIYRAIRVGVGWRRTRHLLVGPGVCLLLIWNGLEIQKTADNFSGDTRQARLQFRPLFQNYPTMPPDTLLFFVAPPIPSGYLSGMMFLRYGSNIIVGGTDSTPIPDLRAHQRTYLIYQDANGMWSDQLIEQEFDAKVQGFMPVPFGDKLSLDELYLSSPRIKRGEPVIVIFQWRVLTKMDRDYTVFTHLLNQDGAMVSGTDQQLETRDGTTRVWRTGNLESNGIIIDGDESILAGKYSLEIGLYDSETQERLPLVDASGKRVDDKIVIAPIQIVE